MTGEYARKQNSPYKEAVTINNANKGDDNDYSIFLGRVVETLYPVNPKMAYQLYMTDPLLMEWRTWEQFQQEMLERLAQD